jgi:hypothetical protein
MGLMIIDCTLAGCAEMIFIMLPIIQTSAAHR